MKRRQTLTFYFSVEGDTEYHYLKWLQNAINRTDKIRYKVKFIIRKDNPLSSVKSITFFEKATVCHLMDFESNDYEHVNKFNNTLALMKKTKNEFKNKIDDYELGYCNYTFELWIILHKKECRKPFSQRGHYLEEINKCYKTNYISLEDFKKENNFKKCLDLLTISDVKSAIKNARIITKHNEKHNKLHTRYSYNYYSDNPSLSIHEIIAKILKLVGIFR
jgi:hypothetical protein